MTSTVEEARNPSLAALTELRKDEHAPLRALFTMVSLEIAGFAMCIPIMSFFAIKELGLSPSQLGLVMSANAASQLIGAWTCGRLSDSFGRRWLLIGSFAWSCMAIGGTAFVYSFTQLLILRTLGGLSGGTSPLCQAYIMDWVKEVDRPAFVGLFGFLVGISFLSGNIIGVCLLLAQFDRRNIFLIAAFFASLATVYGLFTIEESLDPKKRRPLWTPRSDVDAERPQSARAASDCEAVGVGLVCVWVTRFFAALATAIMFSTYAFFIDKAFGWSDVHFGVIMAVFGMLYAFLQFAIYPLFGQHGLVGSAAASLVAQLCGVVGGVLFSMPVVIVHMMSLAFLTVAGALWEPAAPVLVSIFAGESFLGFGNGVATSCRCAASIIGPFLGGVLFEQGLHYVCVGGCLMYFLAVLGSIGIGLSPQPTHDEGKPLLGEAMKA